MTGASTADRDQRQLLRIYVNDHRAAAAAGLALARRCQQNNAGSALGVELLAIVPEIAADAESLETCARRLHLPGNVSKRALAAVGERIARIKPNGRVRGYSPLSRLVEVEALMTGIDAKRSLWRSLGSSRWAADAGVDFDELVRRATDQRERLKAHHEAAARAAFGAGSAAVPSEDSIEHRANLLPEEAAAGSDDAHRQAEVILEESTERVLASGEPSQSIERRTSEDTVEPPERT